MQGFAYWAWEIGASILIDVIVYFFAPLLFIGIVCAIMNNWQAVLKAVLNVFKDVIQMVT